MPFQEAVACAIQPLGLVGIRCPLVPLVSLSGVFCDAMAPVDVVSSVAASSAGRFDIPNSYLT